MNRREFAALLLASGAAGCDTFDNLFKEKKAPLPGERISVLGVGTAIDPDPKLTGVAVALPPPAVNPEWPVPGGNPAHAMGHPALTGSLARVWSTGVGEGSARYTKVLSQPVVAAGRVYAMDGASAVTALDAASGSRLWQVDLKPERERGNAFGGGPCYWNGRLFVTTGYAQVAALDPADGNVIWRQNVASPVHAPPTVADGRVFVVSVDNALDVLSVDDGRRLWTHHGIPEVAGLLGGASPAVDGDIVVVGYSSGELFALRAENGRSLWSDNLAATRTINAIAGLADVRGRPVIDRGRVFAVSHSGRLAAVNLRSGDRAWEQQIGSSHGPWVVGDYVFVLANDNQAVCLTREDGSIRWVRPLTRYRDEKARSGPVFWAGPVLGGSRLIMASSTGELAMLSPETGEPIAQQPISGAVFLGPVIADNTLYLLNDDANLSAYR